MLMNRVRTLSVALLLLPTFTAFAQSMGADTYKSKCQVCHGATGLGDTPAGKAMKASPLNSPAVLKESDAELTAVIKDGKNKMPSFNGKVSDDQIKDLVAYIHTLQK